jgi:acyl-CoA thioesterase
MNAQQANDNLRDGEWVTQRLIEAYQKREKIKREKAKLQVENTSTDNA